MSGIPSLQIGVAPLIEQVARKGVHIFLFTSLTTLLWFGLPALRSRPWVRVLICALLTMAFAIADETRQSFVPGRSGGGWGVVADFIGISLALTVLSVMDHGTKCLGECPSKNM